MQVTPETAEYWDGLAVHELRLPWCLSCGRAHFPPLESCPYCGHDRLEWRVSSGLGALYTWTTTWFDFRSGGPLEPPVTVGIVELREGPRVYAEIRRSPGTDLRLGLPLTAHILRRDGDFVLSFAPLEPAEGRLSPAASPDDEG